MKTQTESLILTNAEGQVLRIYKVENTDNDFMIGLDGSEHFSFRSEDAKALTRAIDLVVDSFEDGP